MSQEDYNTLLRLAKIPRFYRLLRVVRLLRLVKMSRSLDQVFKALKLKEGVGKLVTVLIFVSFIIHMVGCVWHWLAELEGFTPSCWVVRYGYMDKSIDEKY